MKKTIIASLIFSSTIMFLGCEQKKESPDQSQSNIQQKVEEKISEEKSETKSQITQEKQEQKQGIEKQELAKTTEETKQSQTPKIQENKEVQTLASSTNISGEDIFKSKGCTVCHHPEIDTTGPALKKISKFYKGKREKLIQFLKGEGDPIVDPAKFTIMKPQINITKSLSDEELNALVDYILSF